MELRNEGLYVVGYCEFCGEERPCDCDLQLIEEFSADADVDEEAARQARIAAGAEHVCVGCGCSESLPCPGGCVWATPNFCSRCAAPGRTIIV